MPYVNEKMSKEDFEKYTSESFLEKFGSISPRFDWTIDRQRDIWLREYDTLADREEDFGKELWTDWGFYWRGGFVVLRTKFLQKEFSKLSGEFYGYVKILKLKIPKDVEQYKQEMLKDFKEALEASHFGLGIYDDDDETKSVRADLEYDGKLI
jgi:hypothetical protein